MEDMPLTSAVPDRERERHRHGRVTCSHFANSTRTAWGSGQLPCCVHASHSVIQLGVNDTNIPKVTYTQLMNAIKHLPDCAASDQHQTRWGFGPGPDSGQDEDRPGQQREPTQDGHFLTNGKGQL